jgi:hypothetical protein
MASWMLVSILKKHKPHSSFSWILFIRVLENHVFLGTRIDRKISARHVFLSTMHNCTASLFQLYNTKQFLHGCAHGQELSVPRNSTLIRMPRNTGIGSPS